MVKYSTYPPKRRNTSNRLTVAGSRRAIKLPILFKYIKIWYINRGQIKASIRTIVGLFLKKEKLITVMSHYEPETVINKSSRIKQE